jgi:3',5'-cyclic AMP phosphodiesterase CpdA
MNTRNKPTTTPAVRLAHFSDIHLTANSLDWQRGDWLSKRLPGWVNLKWLGREYRFRRADRVLATLAKELRQRRQDRVIFSGDATALGFETEFARAAGLLGVPTPDVLPGLAVPGNHDYYTRASAAAGLFERYFAAWQTGERVDDAPYPFAQRVGPLWLVAVNSCTGNRWFWDAGGSVGPEQLERLESLFERLDPGPRILVTHYPVCLASGAPERSYHGLRDLANLVAVAVRGGVCLWLHGHRHGAYHHTNCKLAPFPVICAGSATQQRHWTYSEYTIDENRLLGLRRVYSPEKDSFQDGEVFSVPLAGRQALSSGSLDLV